MRHYGILLILLLSASFSFAANCFNTNPSLLVHPICSCTDLHAIKDNNLYWNYVLLNDINCSAIANFVPPYIYYGEFDGNYYTISALKINSPSITNVGLFAYATGKIKNLIIVDANVIGKSSVGILAGVSTGKIENSSSSGIITALGHTTAPYIGMVNAGGLVGSTYGGEILNSSSSAFVDCNGYNCGGLVGYNMAKISNTYFNGNVIGRVGATYPALGGLVGYQKDSLIKYSYSSGTVSFLGTVDAQRQYVGGLVGFSNGTLPCWFDGVRVRDDNSVFKSFSTARVNNSTNTYGGGLIGDNNIFSACTGTSSLRYPFLSYWDSTLTNRYYCQKTKDSFFSINTGCTQTTNTASAYFGASGIPFTTLGWDANWYWRDNNYPILTWQQTCGNGKIDFGENCLTCERDVVCGTNSKCVSPGTCVTCAELSESCTTTADCCSGGCYEGTCQDGAPKNYPCASDSECASNVCIGACVGSCSSDPECVGSYGSGARCITGKCCIGSCLGSCESNSQCESNLCINGECAGKKTNWDCEGIAPTVFPTPYGMSADISTISGYSALTYPKIALVNSGNLLFLKKNPSWTNNQLFTYSGNPNNGYPFSSLTDFYDDATNEYIYGWSPIYCSTPPCYDFYLQCRNSSCTASSILNFPVPYPSSYVIKDLLNKDLAVGVDKVISHIQINKVTDPCSGYPWCQYPIGEQVNSMGFTNNIYKHPGTGSITPSITALRAASKSNKVGVIYDGNWQFIPGSPTSTWVESTPYCESTNYGAWTCEDTNPQAHYFAPYILFDSLLRPHTVSYSGTIIRECVKTSQWTCTNYTSSIDLHAVMAANNNSNTSSAMSSNNAISFNLNSEDSLSFTVVSDRNIYFCEKDCARFNCETVADVSPLLEIQNPNGIQHVLISSNSLGERSLVFLVHYLEVFGWTTIDGNVVSYPIPSLFYCKRNESAIGAKIPGDDCIGCVCPVCGNGSCDSGEDIFNCFVDCRCGDGICEEDETNLTCPSDCFCGDGICQSWENNTSCSSDCKGSKNSINEFKVTDSFNDVLEYSCSFDTQINLVVKDSNGVNVFDQNFSCAQKLNTLALPKSEAGGLYSVIGRINPECFVCERQAFFNSETPKESSVPDSSSIILILIFFAFLLFLTFNQSQAKRI